LLHVEKKKMLVHSDCISNISWENKRKKRRKSVSPRKDLSAQFEYIKRKKKELADRLIES